jgi:hypothetical protein
VSKSPASLPTIPSSAAKASQQLRIAFDSIRLRGMSAAERARVLAQLATLLMQAAGAAREERDDEQR